jgi:hypothetical protein
MLGKIGLEEHFAIAETLADSGVILPDRAGLSAGCGVH